MKTSEKCEKLHGQLFKALQEIPVMPKNAKGFGYNYTTLDTIVETVKPILFKNNLCFMQSIDDNSITTRIFNEQGEYIESSATLPDVEIAKANKAQNAGASISYMRRYCLSAMLGIVADDDTDGVVKQPQQQRPIKNLEPKIQELKSYYSIISPEAQTACSLAIADHDEAKIDQYIKQAKDKKEKMIQEGNLLIDTTNRMR